jgi:hypothetical protein
MFFPSFLLSRVRTDFLTKPAHFEKKKIKVLRQHPVPTTFAFYRIGHAR